MKIIAYTDGSAVAKGKCTCNQCPKCDRLGGFGVYVIYNNKEEFLSKGYSNTTISRMEMRGVLYAIKKVPKNIKTLLQIHSDSQFIVNSFNKGWLDKWKLENFINRLNSDLWKRIIKEIESHPKMLFKINHTRGHRKDLDNEIAYGNAIADDLASYKNFKEFKKDSI